MFTFKVLPDGQEPFEVTATTRDVLQWEKVDKSHNITRMQENPSAVDIYSLAHIACRRRQLFSGTLAEFEDSCDIAFGDETEDEDEPDPTRGGR